MSSFQCSTFLCVTSIEKLGWSIIQFFRWAVTSVFTGAFGHVHGIPRKWSGVSRRWYAKATCHGKDLWNLDPKGKVRPKFNCPTNNKFEDADEVREEDGEHYGPWKQGGCGAVPRPFSARTNCIYIQRSKGKIFFYRIDFSNGIIKSLPLWCKPSED